MNIFHGEVYSKNFTRWQQCKILKTTLFSQTKKIYVILYWLNIKLSVLILFITLCNAYYCILMQSILNSSSDCLFVWCMSVCNVFFTMVPQPYISAKIKENDTKVSGYDPWGLPRSSMSSRMTPPSWHTSNKDINLKFSAHFPGARKWSSMTSRTTL